MAIELHLQKTTKAPWGFTLAGGVEYEVPLTVIKVIKDENSKHESGCLYLVHASEGDIEK